MNNLCPGAEFFQIAVGPEIQNPLEWLLNEFRTTFERLPNECRTTLEYSKIFQQTIYGKEKDIGIVLKLTSKLFLIIFDSTFGLKALCSNDTSDAFFVWGFYRIYSYCKTLRRGKSYSRRSIKRAPDNTNPRYIELKPVLLGLVNPYKNSPCI